MEIVYFGKKRPKKIHTVSPERFSDVKINNEGITYIPLAGEELKYSFEPFKAVEVDDQVGQILVDRSGGLFKSVGEAKHKPRHQPVIKTDGYVGARPADEIPDLGKQVEADKKAEKGKDIEEIIEESRKKKKKKKKEKED